jgi:hypothetical protein
MSDCRYNVYKLPRGGKQEILAKFERGTDAVNFAHEKSVGEFNADDISIKVYDRVHRAVLIRYKQGERA